MRDIRNQYGTLLGAEMVVPTATETWRGIDRDGEGINCIKTLLYRLEVNTLLLMTPQSQESPTAKKNMEIQNFMFLRLLLSGVVGDVLMVWDGDKGHALITKIGDVTLSELQGRLLGLACKVTKKEQVAQWLERAKSELRPSLDGAEGGGSAITRRRNRGGDTIICCCDDSDLFYSSRYHHHHYYHHYYYPYYNQPYSRGGSDLCPQSSGGGSSDNKDEVVYIALVVCAFISCFVAGMTSVSVCDKSLAGADPRNTKAMYSTSDTRKMFFMAILSSCVLGGNLFFRGLPCWTEGSNNSTGALHQDGFEGPCLAEHALKVSIIALFVYSIGLYGTSKYFKRPSVDVVARQLAQAGVPGLSRASGAALVKYLGELKKMNLDDKAVGDVIRETFGDDFQGAWQGLVASVASAVPPAASAAPEYEGEDEDKVVITVSR